MAWLIFGDADVPITIERVTLGGYQLARVAADDPAVRAAIDPAWRMTEVLVLHPVREVPAWEQRVAKEFAAELGGTARPVTLAGAPTPLALPAAPTSGPRDEPDALTSAALAAWLAACRDPDGFVPPAHHPAIMPAGAVDVTIDVVPVGADELAALAAAVHADRATRLPDAYLALLRDVGVPRVEWLDGDGVACHRAELLTPGEVLADLADFDDRDAVIAFFRDSTDAVFAFDPAADPAAIVVREDGEVTDLTALTFGAWLASWHDSLGAGLFERVPTVEVTPPPGAAALVRRWNGIVAWVRPMYDDWDRAQRA